MLIEVSTLLLLQLIWPGPRFLAKCDEDLSPTRTMWVAKKGAVVSAMVAAMVACVMAALTVTRSVRRWTRLKKLRRQFEESEGRKLVARPQGRHSYTEFTEF